MKAYQKAFRQFKKVFPEERLLNVTADELLKWRKQKLQEVSRTTWNNLVRHLYAVFKFGIEQALLPTPVNPFKGLQVKVGKQPKKTINDRTFRKLESLLQEELFLPDILKPRWFILTLIKTLKYTAIRRRQLLNLKLSDIDLDRRLITLNAEYNKNHDYHIIPISDKLLPDLEHLLAEHRKYKSVENAQLFNLNLFCNVTKRKGQPMTDDQLSNLFRVISKQISSNVSPHKFRHTTATELMRKNSNNLYNVQKLLGHKDIKTTLGYVEYDPEIIRGCVNNI